MKPRRSEQRHGHATTSQRRTALEFAATPSLGAESAIAIDLPPPRADGGRPLMQALQLRRSIRKYSDQPLPKQVLSDLLWAAFASIGLQAATAQRPIGDTSW